MKYHKCIINRLKYKSHNRAVKRDGRLYKVNIIYLLKNNVTVLADNTKVLNSFKCKAICKTDDKEFKILMHLISQIHKLHYSMKFHSIFDIKLFLYLNINLNKIYKL